MAAGQNAALKEAATTEGGVSRSHPATGVSRIVDADAGHVEFLMPDGETPRKKFALVGFASSTREMAPFHDPEWVVMGMNQLNRHIPRADAWIEIHKEWNTAVVPGTDHTGWLRDCGIPVLMAQRIPELPTSVTFPINRLIDKFADYFTSTVAYMVAYFVDHIDREVESRMKDSPSNGLATAWDVAELQKSMYSEYTIGIFGIDLIVGEEYTWQRPCAEYHLGQALARNITVMVPPQSALLTQRYRYGFAMEPDDIIKDSDFEKRKAYLIGEHQKYHQASLEVAGALKEMDYWSELRTLRERGGKVG